MSVVTVYIMNVYFYKNVLKFNRFDKTFQVLGNNAIQSAYQNPEHEDIELKELLKDQITILEKANSCKWPPVGLCKSLCGKTNYKMFKACIKSVIVCFQ